MRKEDMKVTFPTTVAEFIANQEGGAGRRMNEPERKLLAATAEFLNECYYKGKNEGGKLWAESGAEAVEVFREAGRLEELEDPFIIRCLVFILIWQEEAYSQGMKAAMKSMEG